MWKDWKHQSNLKFIQQKLHLHNDSMHLSNEFVVFHQMNEWMCC
jgi:hypothetical protein